MVIVNFTALRAVEIMRINGVAIQTVLFIQKIIVPVIAINEKQPYKWNFYISGISTILLGLLISLGPQYIFKVCGMSGKCRMTAQAEIGIGILVCIFGLALLIFTDPKVQIGMSTGALFAGIIVILYPYLLIGGCENPMMMCQRVGFPALAVEGSILILLSAFNACYLAKYANVS